MILSQAEIYRHNHPNHTRLHLPYEKEESRDVKGVCKHNNKSAPKFTIYIISKSKRESWNKMG